MRETQQISVRGMIIEIPPNKSVIKITLDAALRAPN